MPETMLIAAPGRLAAFLAEADCRRVWLVGLLSGISRWLEMLVVGVYAFEATGSPLLVTLLVILRFLPLVILGSVIGTLADRASPRLYLLAGLVSVMIVSATVCGLFVAGRAEYWMVAAATFASGVFWTTDMPLRRRMLGDIAGKDRLVLALSFDSATNSATRMIGPVIGGIVLQVLDVEGAFALATVLYLSCVVLTLRVSASIVPGSNDGRLAGLLTGLVESVRHAVRERDVLQILLVTIVFNVWAFPFVTMIPVIGSERLQLDAGGIGALAALEGAGAFLGSLVLSMTAQPGHLRPVYYFGVVAYLAFAFGVGWLAAVPSVTAAVFCIGLGAGAFSGMQSTLIYSVAPPHMRSRLLGLMTICIGTGVVGMLNIGLMAEWFGAAAAIRLVAAEGAVALMMIGFTWPQLWGRA